MIRACSILRFRRDLRTCDNAVLDWVCENSTRITPVYIHSPDEEKPWAPGVAACWWLHRSLSSLEKALANKGLKLHFYCGNSKDVILKIIADSKADCLVYNRLYEQHIHDRDSRIEKKLHDEVEVISFDSGLLFSPGTVLNNQQLPYRVCKRFYNKVRQLLSAAHFQPTSQSSDDSSKGFRSVF